MNPFQQKTTPGYHQARAIGVRSQLSANLYWRDDRFFATKGSIRPVQMQRSSRYTVAFPTRPSFKRYRTAPTNHWEFPPELARNAETPFANPAGEANSEDAGPAAIKKKP